MPISDSQLTANRENAQHSTGPRTPEGKQRSSLNALRHGLTSQVVVMPYEDMQAYVIFCEKYISGFDVQGEPERQLAQDLANTQWRINRCHSIECGIYALPHSEHGDAIDIENTQIHATLTAASVYLENDRGLENLSRHENRLRRNFQSTLKQLHEMQDRRRMRELNTLDKAIAIYKTHKMQNLPYNPADDGFVLSVPQIEQHIARKQRAEDAELAARHRFNPEKFRIAKAA
ncbi:MAG: hypothetical protein ACR2NN_18790 [Bryobacteraceae bacterium]